MLAYLPDPDNKALRQELLTTVNSRENRAMLMVDKLAEDYDITWEDVRRHATDWVVTAEAGRELVVSIQTSGAAH